MKTIIVKVDYENAERCNFVGINNVPSYLNEELVVKILSGYTKYDIDTASELEVLRGIHEDYARYDTASSMERAIKIVKDIKLYTIKEEYTWKFERNTIETIQFRLSDIFNIKMSSDNPWNTFFLIECDKPDVSFDDTRLKEDLHINVAKNGYYYLRGNWEFNRVNEKIVEAIRYEDRAIRVVLGKKRVEL